MYAGLFGDDLDAVASRLNEAVAARDADYLRTGATTAASSILREGEAQAGDLGSAEPRDGIEPSTYALRDQICRLVCLARSRLACKNASRHLSLCPPSRLGLLRTR